MGKTFDSIPENKIEWIKKQEVFWVATAPLAGDGHVNVSPKGLRGSFFIDNPNRVWYEDLSGSGCETIAHVKENGRITILFNAFEGPPDIVRLYGTGSIHEFGSPEYELRIPLSKRKATSRAVIIIDVHRVATSCGWGVPYYKFEGHRKTLLTWGRVLEKNDANFEVSSDVAPTSPEPAAVARNGMKAWWRKENTSSIDGLPALVAAPLTRQKLENSVPDMEEGAFKVKEAQVKDLAGLDESSLWGPVLSRALRRDDRNGGDRRRFNSNLKLFVGALIGFCLAQLLSALFVSALFVQVQARLVHFVRRIVP